MITPDLRAVAVDVQITAATDGVHHLLVTLNDGRKLELKLNADKSGLLVRSLQDLLMEEAIRNPASGQMPIPIPLEIGGSTLGHGQDGPGVMVSTDRFGWLALVGSIDRLQALGREVARAIVAIEAKKWRTN